MRFRSVFFRIAVPDCSSIYWGIHAFDSLQTPHADHSGDARVLPDSLPHFLFPPSKKILCLFPASFFCFRRPKRFPATATCRPLWGWTSAARFSASFFCFRQPKRFPTNATRVSPASFFCFHRPKRFPANAACHPQ